MSRLVLGYCPFSRLAIVSSILCISRGLMFGNSVTALSRRNCLVIYWQFEQSGWLS